MDQKEFQRLISDELQDVGYVLQSHEDGINDLTAEKVEDRTIMRAIQKRLESLHKRIAKLEQRPQTGN